MLCFIRFGKKNPRSGKLYILAVVQRRLEKIRLKKKKKATWREAAEWWVGVRVWELQREEKGQKCYGNRKEEGGRKREGKAHSSE